MLFGFCCCAATANDSTELQESPVGLPRVAATEAIVDGVNEDIYLSAPKTQELTTVASTALASQAPFRADDSIDDAAASSKRGVDYTRSAFQHKVQDAASMWKKQGIDTVWLGAATLFKGIGDAFAAIYQHRKLYVDPLVAFIFLDPFTSVVAETSPTDATARTRTFSASSWTSWASSEPEPAGPRSLRLCQRNGQVLRIIEGSEVSAGMGQAITDEILAADVEALMTRVDRRVDSVTGQLISDDTISASISPGPSPASASSSQPSPASGKRSTVGIADFALSAQFGCASQLFRALVDAFQNGPLLEFTMQGIDDDEVLRGLTEAWPQTTALLRTICDVKNSTIHLTKTAHDCAKVSLQVPLDLKAMGAKYSSIAQLLEVLRSVNVHFRDRPSLPGSSVESPSRVACVVSYEDGTIRCRFTVRGKLLAWTDETGNPLLGPDSTVDTVEAPAAPRELPGRKKLILYCCLSGGRLGLSKVGCIGLNNLPLPDTCLRVTITSEPHKATDGTDVLDGEALLASVVLRMVEVSAFPSEFLIRPFFNAKLMRALLVESFELSWTVGPSALRPSEWQLVASIRSFVPSVAQAFKACFRLFARRQLAESDVLKLLADAFIALSADLRNFESMKSACAVADATLAAS